MIAVAVSGPHPLVAQCTAHRAHARRGSMLRALKMHGGVARVDLGRENVDAARAGCANLPRHLVNVEQFGVPVVVAVNQFSADTEAELQAVVDAAGAEGAQAIVCSHWADGGAGTEALVRHVVEIVEAGEGTFRPPYPDDWSLRFTLTLVNCDNLG